MVNILGIAMKLMGRYGGLTGKTLVEGVGNKFLLVEIFGLAKREKFDHLEACMSVHRTN